MTAARTPRRGTPLCATIAPPNDAWVWTSRVGSDCAPTGGGKGPTPRQPRTTAIRAAVHETSWTRRSRRGTDDVRRCLQGLPNSEDRSAAVRAPAGPAAVVFAPST